MLHKMLVKQTFSFFAAYECDLNIILKNTFMELLMYHSNILMLDTRPIQTLVPKT